MARNNKSVSKPRKETTPKVEMVIKNNNMMPVKVEVGGKFKILNTGCIYLDPTTRKSYQGSDVFVAKNFSHYERRNMARNKEEARSTGKAFYRVED